MSLLIQCQSCGDRRRVNERLAGRKIRCPSCEAVLRVPVPAAKAKPGNRADTGSDQDAGKNGVAGSASAAGGGAAAGAINDAAGGPGVSVPTMSVPESLSVPNLLNGSENVPSTSEPLVDDDQEDWNPPRREREEEELDMTPMVDVTFLLLIFFMVTASFSLQKSIEMPRQQSDLPSLSVQDEPTEELDPVELEIDENGGFLVLAADWEEETPGKQNLILALKRAVAGNRDGMKLNVKVHENAKLQYLVDGMDAGTIAGFSEIEVTEVDSFN